MEWHVIKTAPMDGSPILLLLADGNIVKARHYYPFGEDEHIKNKWGYQESWHPLGVVSYDEVWLSSEPTHWTSLEDLRIPNDLLFRA